MKKKKQKPVVPIRFEKNMTKALKSFAKKDGRTFAGLVRYILAEWLERKGAACLMLMFAVSAIILMGCSNPTASKTAAIAWKEVKIYYNMQLSLPFDNRIACKDSIRIICLSDSNFKIIGYFRSGIKMDTLPLHSNQTGIIPDAIDTIRLLTKNLSDTIRSYYCNGGEDTLIVTKDTTWILN